MFLKKFKLFLFLFYFKLIFFFVFLDYFDVLMLKVIYFFKKKNFTMNAGKITYISGKHLAKAYFSVIALLSLASLSVDIEENNFPSAISFF
jgi:hypothetical protein